MSTYVFIDASNLFYGGEKSLGWKIDYQKLYNYLGKKYEAVKVFYFGGIETHSFLFNYLENETVSLTRLETYLRELLRVEGSSLNEAELLLIGRHMKRLNFYQKLEHFGYTLILKPVKLYAQEDGSTKRKANCDVDMAFYLMKEKENFDTAVILSGDGDFLPVLKYLKTEGKHLTVLARSPRTAKEIKQFAGSDFRDFAYLREQIRRSK